MDRSTSTSRKTMLAVLLLLATCAAGATEPALAAPSHCLHGIPGTCDFFVQSAQQSGSNGAGLRSENHELLLASLGAASKREGLGRHAAKVIHTSAQTNDTGNETEILQNGSAAAASGVTLNAAGDLSAFIAAVILYVGMCLGMIAFFNMVKEQYPLIYQNNIVTGKCPQVALVDGKIPAGFFGWAKLALGTPTTDSEETAGLDAAMLVEFTDFCKKTLFIIAVPMVVVMGSLHFFCGGKAAGEDHLSYLSMGNVENGSWLYWIHALVIWAVVITLRLRIFQAQKSFIVRRQKWLKALPATRAMTILVESIPEKYCSNKELKDLFSDMFGADEVKSAYVVKDTSELVKLQYQQEAAEAKLAKAKASKDQDTVLQADLQKTISELETKVENERQRINDAKDTPGGVNQQSGFVTFNSRTAAETALNLQYLEDAEEMLVSTPPDVASLRWEDLNQGETSSLAYTLLGYGLVAGLYAGYLPIVIGITNIANTIDMGPIQPIWEGLAPTLGLQFMVAFLPTFLILIFRFCFTLKADVYAQHKLQNWYFVFNIVFVVMVTAIGSNAVEFVESLLQDPFSVPFLLADTMPYATHFYMNFIVMQWFTHFMNFTRYMSLSKFIAFTKVYENDVAREMSEPEDQDYYGMGSRSARFTTNMVIAIVFGTLSPPLLVLVWMNFVVCRAVYGYLMVFAETRKPDTGGVFWVSQLDHLFVGMIIYCVMMTGVLWGRSATSGPAIIALPSLAFVMLSHRRFRLGHSWEKLPYKVLADMKKDPSSMGKSGTKDDEYIQVELLSKPQT